jgi:hypothetical protein
MTSEPFDFSNMSDDNKIKLLGILTTIIVACIGGIFALMAAFVQRPTPSANPTQVIVIINATPIPTSAFQPTSTPFPTHQVTESSTPTPTSVTEPTKTYPNNTASSNFSVPWSNWIIDFVILMPQDTWIAIVIFLGILFLVAGGAIFFSAKLSFDFRIVFMLLAMVITFIISINNWGWWGVLWGFLLAYLVMLVLGIKFIFGATVGGASGILISTSLSLFYITWTGYLNKEIITSWSVIGFLTGIVIGMLFVHETAFDS